MISQRWGGPRRHRQYQERVCRVEKATPNVRKGRHIVDCLSPTGMWISAKGQKRPVDAWQVKQERDKGYRKIVAPDFTSVAKKTAKKQGVKLRKLSL